MIYEYVGVEGGGSGNGRKKEGEWGENRMLVLKGMWYLIIIV